MDVDGVLNVLSATDPGLEFHLVDGDPVWVRPEMAAHLRSLEEAFEWVWCTAWDHEADRAFRRILGLRGGHPYLPYRDPKLPQILHAAQARPFAWVDDEVSKELRDHPHLVVPGHGLTLCTQAEEGLTPEQAEQLMRFAAAHSCSRSEPPVDLPASRG